MDAVQQAAETIRSYIDERSDHCLHLSVGPPETRQTQARILELARAQLGELDRVRGDPQAIPSEYGVPSDFSAVVDRSIVGDDRTYEWRSLASVMLGTELLLERIRAQRLNRDP